SAPAGPSLTAAWIDRDVAAAGQPAAVTLLPDAAGDRRGAAGAPSVFHTLLRRPALWHDATGVPVLSLTLVLTRTPSPDDENVSPLVEHGILAFDVRLSVPPDAQRAAGSEFPGCRPIFARAATVDLIWTSGGDRPVSIASTTGIVLRAGLSARLDRTQALDVLSTLAGGVSSFRLRGRIDFRATDPATAVTALRSLDFDASLDEVLKGALSAGGAHRHIQLISPVAGAGSGLGTAPARVRSAPAATREGSDPTQRLTTTGTGLKSLTLAMQPSRLTASPAAIVASDLVRPAHGAVAIRPQHWLVENAIFDTAVSAPARSLPIVSPADAPIWRDRLDAGRHWYAPVIELVRPDPRLDTSASPFTFTFRRTGATASGDAALSGVVKLTLRRTMSDATQAALRALGNGQARAIAPSSISIVLEIPYVSTDVGQLKTTVVPGKVTATGDTYTVTFDLLNEWVRLAYGSLSQPGFQAEPARIRATWSFEGYVPIKGQKLQLVAATTEARAPNVHLAHAVMTASPAMAIRPQIQPNLAVLEQVRKTLYSLRTHIRQNSVDVVLPCEELGAFYLETSATGTAAVGCVEALRLGHTTLRQYAEMPEVPHPAYRVLRSLQQPGRFLLLPAAYRITRYGSSVADRAFRPAVAVYSALDAANTANNRVVFHATLQPDLPPHERRLLRTRLAARARDPQIELPTEIQAECDYVWTLGAGASVEPRVIKAPDGFQVTLATDLAGALLVKTMLQTAGVSGTVGFLLPDGTRFQSLLHLDLGRVTGPWETGPIEIAISNGRARLTNRIERPVEVSDLLGFPPVDGLELPVEKLIPPSGVHEVAVPAGASEWFAVSSQPAVGPVVLEEIRSFIEDIHTNVTFLDLTNHPSHGLQDLQVEARLRNVPGANALRLAGDPPSATAEFILPLTTYLASRILQFRVTKTFTAAAPQTTPWLDWDLDRNGNVVSLTWELIG
ncbi:MAG TPA: hypothetical protein VJ813_02050, partial [Vicinamibacterales bacterium]|nr:hypothetical protein [Vicinamibacterales bacterium]